MSDVAAEPLETAAAASGTPVESIGDVVVGWITAG